MMVGRDQRTARRGQGAPQMSQACLRENQVINAKPSRP
jgi:hypothetical protein